MPCHRNRERGAVAIEAALIVGLLVLIALGAFEYGMAFRSSLGVAAASREGARVGASIGTGYVVGDTIPPGVNENYDADCRILEAAAAALASSTDNEVVRIRIILHDPADPNDEDTFNSYRPFISGTDSPALQRCNTWFQEYHTWDENTRDNVGEDRDWVKVEVEYKHFWITGFAWWSGSMNWTNSSTMRVEPVVYGG